MASVTVVGSTAVRLIDPNDVQNPIVDAIKTSLYNNTDITDEIKKTTRNGFNVACDRYLQYGRETFVNGLPGADLGYYGATVDDVTAVVAQIEGGPVTATGFTSGARPDVEFRAIQYMQWFFDYDSATQEVFKLQSMLGIASTVAVYYDSMSVIDATTVNITYKYNLGAGNVTQTVETTTRPWQESLPVLYLKYYVNSDTSQDIKHFWYLPGTGEFPTLDVFVGQHLEGIHYPIAPIKTNGVNTIDVIPVPPPGFVGPVTSDYTDTTRTMLKHLGIDLEQLTTDLDSDPANPDNLKNIDDIFLMFAVDIQTQSEVGINYLMDWFIATAAEANVTKAQFDAWESGDKIGYENARPMTRYTTYDGEMNQATHFDYIEVNTVTSNIGAVGTVNSSTTIADRVTYEKIIEVEKSTITFRRQINSTQVEELTVHGLNQWTEVKPKSTDMTLAISIEADSFFLIPLEHARVKALTAADESLILQEAIHLVLHAVEKIKLEWYQTVAFKFLFTVLIVVIAVLTLQPQLAGIIGAGTWTAAAVLVLQLVVTSMLVDIVVDYVVDLLVDALGDDAAIIVAIIAMVAAVYYGEFGGVDGLPFAQDLLRAATALTAGIDRSVKEQMGELIDEADDFFKTAKEKQEELDMAASGLLPDVQSYLIQDSILYFNHDESPTDYFSRTIGQGNIGVLSLDAISNYVDSTLILPKPD